MHKRWRAACAEIGGRSQVDEVLWIEATPPVPLAIVLCPFGGGILKDELREIARSGVETLVSLLEPAEAGWLGLGEEGPLAEQSGMNFLSSRFRTFMCRRACLYFAPLLRDWPSGFAWARASACTAGEASAGRRSPRPAR